MMGGTDMRGFSYALEPVRRRRAWDLEAALGRLGNLSRRLDEKRKAGEALRADCAAQALQASRAWTARPDPATHSRLLQYLVELHARTVEADREIDALVGEVRVARDQCASEQQALDVIDRHRGQMLGSYATEQERRFSAYADADWVARAGDRRFAEGSR
jgi:hypothetical protein